MGGRKVYQSEVDYIFNLKRHGVRDRDIATTLNINVNRVYYILANKKPRAIWFQMLLKLIGKYDDTYLARTL